MRLGEEFPSLKKKLLNPAGKLRSSPGPSVMVGQLEKALVHSSPSSASILLPVASTSTDRKRLSRSPGNRGKASSPRTSLSPRGYSRVASRSTLGICNPRIQSAGLVVKSQLPDVGLIGAARLRA
jgi:hypothetical protein